MIPTILQGNNATINLFIADGYDCSDCVLEATINGIEKTYVLTSNRDIVIMLTPEETSRFPIGTSKILLRLRNNAGETRVLPWGKIKVTDAPEEVYSTSIIVDPGGIDVADVSDADSITAMKEKLNAIIAFLRGKAAFIVAFALFSSAVAIDRNTQLNDIPGTNTIADIGRAIGGVTASTVTNISRSVVNQVKDEKTQIVWRPTMYNGNLYYVAVTNMNIAVTNGVPK